MSRASPIPLTHTTAFQHDPAGNLTAIVDSLSAWTTIAYNTGQPGTITDPFGDATTVGYDAVGNLTILRDPLQHPITRTFDAVSRLRTQTDPRQKVTTFDYDRLNRLTQQGQRLHKTIAQYAVAYRSSVWTPSSVPSTSPTRWWTPSVPGPAPR